MRSLPLLLCGCSGALPGPGRPGSVDADEDGWAIADGDCDDADPEAFPLALDDPGDGVDQDCDGADATALEVRALVEGDLVVTEIMAEPLAVGADYGEWFEVASAVDLPVDLRGLVVHDEGGDDFEIDRELVIEPGGRVVLGVSGDEDRNGGVEPDFVYDPKFGLSTTEDAIVLEVVGTVVDRVAWRRGWPLVDGAALSLSPDRADDNDDEDSWCPAIDLYGVAGYGTPGEENPPCPPKFEGLDALELQPGDLVITEALVAPLSVPDPLGEWIEVLNATNAEVDLGGVTLSDELGASWTLPSTRVPAGARVVLGASAEPEENGGVEVDVAWGFGFSLADEGQVVALSVGTRELDRVAYAAELGFPVVEGASMSLDPGAEQASANESADRWCLGTTRLPGGDRGSPGEPNPPCE